jgi:crotonobetainyl-CoA:carnitine CoA-transferase CaiB-like acyl-CoA transferase
MNKPLNGVRILDLTHMLSGPYGAMILADLGAETIKVEPLHGEGTRKLLAKDPDNSLDGMGAYYITLNRNKQSVAIDLKSEGGKAVFHDLVRESDVVISNFGVGVPERLGVDYATLAEINPRIITCTVTGFGSDGPNPKRPAFDQVAQAMGGGMSITGPDADHQVRAGIPIGDLGGGMFAVMGVLSALVERGVAAMADELGEEALVEIPKEMGGEDFSRYGRTAAKIPSFMIRVGTVPQGLFDRARRGEATLPSLHSPFFAPDPEPTLDTGTRAMTVMALDLLAP